MPLSDLLEEDFLPPSWQFQDDQPAPNFWPVDARRRPDPLPIPLARD